MLARIETIYRPGELTAVAYRDGEETGRTSLPSATGAARLTASLDRRELRDDDADLAFLSIELRDDGGVLVTSEELAVSVTVDGAGVLAGMCSANPRTQERFDANTWQTFDGRALAVVRPNGRGAVTVTVSAEGHKPVVVGLMVN